jgi:hypothetical protein
MDVQHGRGHEVRTWTCSLYFTCCTDGNSALTWKCSMDMNRQHEDGHAARCPRHVHVKAGLSGIQSVPYRNGKKTMPEPFRLSRRIPVVFRVRYRTEIWMLNAHAGVSFLDAGGAQLWYVHCSASSLCYPPYLSPVLASHPQIFPAYSLFLYKYICTAKLHHFLPILSPPLIPCPW